MGDRTLSQTLYEKLEEIIAAAKPGERLPSEPRLAKQLGVSRATLREVMRAFETRGLLRRRQGLGTFVVHPTRVIESGLEVLESIETLAKRIGLQVSMRDLSIQRRAATEEEAEQLGLSLQSPVLSVSRVIFAEGRPVAYLIDTLPVGILDEEEVRPNFSGSVLDVLLRRGNPLLGNSRCEIGAVAAEAVVARALNIQRGDALLRFVSLLYTVDGRAVDYSHSYFLPGYFRFHVVRRVG
jgi:GntR family transcriptional regulator